MDDDIEEILGELQDDSYWDNAKIKILVEMRLEDEKDFCDQKKKKSTLWKICLRKIKNIHPNFPFTSEQCSKKFNNLFTTYKKIRKRNNETGRNRTHWEYYNCFHDVYGTSHAISPPEDNLILSLSQNDDLEIPSLSPENFTPRRNNEEHEMEDLQVQPSSSKNRKVEMDAFLKQFAEKEEQRHQEFIKIEAEKLKIEKEKLEVLKELKDLLKNSYQIN